MCHLQSDVSRHFETHLGGHAGQPARCNLLIMLSKEMCKCPCTGQTHASTGSSMLRSKTSLVDRLKAVSMGTSRALTSLLIQLHDTATIHVQS